jgi:aminopeptidase N
MVSTGGREFKVVLLCFSVAVAVPFSLTFNLSVFSPDLLAVPKHPYAAMENWGLSVFVEQKILLDPEVSSFSYQMELTMVVVHEICHQV